MPQRSVDGVEWTDISLDPYDSLVAAEYVLEIAKIDDLNEQSERVKYHYY